MSALKNKEAAKQFGYLYPHHHLSSPSALQHLQQGVCLRIRQLDHCNLQSYHRCRKIIRRSEGNEAETMNSCLPPIRRFFSFSREPSPQSTERPISPATTAVDGHTPLTYTYTTTAGGQNLKFDLYLPLSARQQVVVRKRSRLLRREKEKPSVSEIVIGGRGDDKPKLPVVIYFGDGGNRRVALKGFIGTVLTLLSLLFWQLTRVSVCEFKKKQTT
jgi:hypothetical protein